MALTELALDLLASVRSVAHFCESTLPRVRLHLHCPHDAHCCPFGMLQAPMKSDEGMKLIFMCTKWVAVLAPCLALVYGCYFDDVSPKVVLTTTPLPFACRCAYRWKQ